LLYGHVAMAISIAIGGMYACCKQQAAREKEKASSEKDITQNLNVTYNVTLYITIDITFQTL
jgi:hypothetical protein